MPESCLPTDVLIEIGAIAMESERAEILGRLMLVNSTRSPIYDATTSTISIDHPAAVSTVARELDRYHTRFCHCQVVSGPTPLRPSILSPHIAPLMVAAVFFSIGDESAPTNDLRTLFQFLGAPQFTLSSDRIDVDIIISKWPLQLPHVERLRFELGPYPCPEIDEFDDVSEDHEHDGQEEGESIAADREEYDEFPWSHPESRYWRATLGKFPSATHFYLQMENTLRVLDVDGKEDKASTERILSHIKKKMPNIRSATLQYVGPASYMGYGARRKEFSLQGGAWVEAKMEFQTIAGTWA